MLKRGFIQIRQCNPRETKEKKTKKEKPQICNAQQYMIK